MLRFEPWPGRWWNKPLVDLGGRILPAALAVLAAEEGPNEPAGNQNVRHYHVHVFPRYGGDDLYGSKRAPAPIEKRIERAALLRRVLDDQSSQLTAPPARPGVL